MIVPTMEQRGGDRANNNEEQSLSSAIISRRKLLEMSGAAAAVGLAGCSSGDDTESTSTPLQGKNRSTATSEKYDTGTSQNTDAQQAVEDSTEETSTSPTESGAGTQTPQKNFSKLEKPFHNVPDPSNYLEEDILVQTIDNREINNEEALNRMSVMHRDFESIRDSLENDRLWGTIRENGGGEANRYRYDRAKNNDTGIELSDVLDWAQGKAGGELISYNVGQPRIEYGLGESGLTGTEWERKGKKNGWNTFSGFYRVGGSEAEPTKGLAAVKENQAIFVNEKVEVNRINMTNPYMEKPEVEDLDKLLDIWTKTVNKEGETLKSYAETDEDIAKLEEFYLNSEEGYEHMQIQDYNYEIEDIPDNKEIPAEAVTHNFGEESVTLAYHKLGQDGNIASPEEYVNGWRLPIMKLPYDLYYDRNT